MRTLVQMTVPTTKGNEAIKTGSLEKVIQQAAERWHPEAMYFTAFEGKRGGFMVVDLPDTSAIPPFAEPFFDQLEAELRFYPVMNVEDLSKGLGQLTQH